MTHRQLPANQRQHNYNRTKAFLWVIFELAISGLNLVALLSLRQLRKSSRAGKTTVNADSGFKPD